MAVLLGLVGALALVAEGRPGLSNDPDLRCFMATAFAAGSLKDDAATQAGLASVMMYYFGKLEARFPGADLKGEITRMVQLPAFQRGLQADMRRCGAEAQEKGQALQDLGQYLIGIAPLLDAKPG